MGITEELLDEIRGLRADLAAHRGAPAPLLTAEQAADLIGHSVESIRTMGKRGRIPSVKLPNGARRYEAVELLRWAHDGSPGALLVRD